MSLLQIYGESFGLKLAVETSCTELDRIIPLLDAIQRGYLEPVFLLQVVNDSGVTHGDLQKTHWPFFSLLS